jgi:nucleoside-diphosphate-sugar epimerase
MKAFVTGGTGFVGKRVVRQLMERGYDVTCLVRSPEQATHLREMGVTLVPGDVTNRDSMRAGMTGADVVFHLAAWHEASLPPGADERMERINVGGAENVLGLAVELDVPKIVYTSTVNVLGETHGVIVDETYRHTGPFRSVYDQTKHQAHQLAEQYAAQGAPVIIVMPGTVYGPGDTGMLCVLWQLLLRRMLPLLPGADIGLSFVHVDDVAQGHVLAAERGQIGQSYILGGDAMTIGDAVQIVTRLAGVPAPLLFLNSNLAMPLQPLMRWLERFAPLPPLLSAEMARWLGTTWLVSSDKAEHELGYTHRSFEEGMAETVAWEATQLHGKLAFAPGRTTKVLLALTAAASVSGLILLLRGISHRRRTK